jgi:hypothetical protein
MFSCEFAVIEHKKLRNCCPSVQDPVWASNPVHREARGAELPRKPAQLLGNRSSKIKEFVNALDTDPTDYSLAGRTPVGTAAVNSRSK